MTEEKKREEISPQLFQDDFFEKGHLLRKIWQIIIAIFGWALVIIPIVLTYFIWTRPTINVFGYRIQLQGGFFTLEYLTVVLLFAFLVSAVYVIGMSILQNRKRARLVEQWPTFDPLQSTEKRDIQEAFITERFGNAEFRQNVRTYTVKPEQNLETNQLNKLTGDIAEKSKQGANP